MSRKKKDRIRAHSNHLALKIYVHVYQIWRIEHIRTREDWGQNFINSYQNEMVLLWYSFSYLSCQSNSSTESVHFVFQSRDTENRTGSIQQVDDSHIFFPPSVLAEPPLHHFVPRRMTPLQLGVPRCNRTYKSLDNLSEREGRRKLGGKKDRIRIKSTKSEFRPFLCMIPSPFHFCTLHIQIIYKNLTKLQEKTKKGDDTIAVCMWASPWEEIRNSSKRAIESNLQVDTQPIGQTARINLQESYASQEPMIEGKKLSNMR